MDSCANFVCIAVIRHVLPNAMGQAYHWGRGLFQGKNMKKYPTYHDIAIWNPLPFMGSYVLYFCFYLFVSKKKGLLWIPQKVPLHPLQWTSPLIHGAMKHHEALHVYFRFKDVLFQSLVPMLHNWKAKGLQGLKTHECFRQRELVLWQIPRCFHNSNFQWFNPNISWSKPVWSPLFSYVAYSTSESSMNQSHLCIVKSSGKWSYFINLKSSASLG